MKQKSNNKDKYYKEDDHQRLKLVDIPKLTLSNWVFFSAFYNNQIKILPVTTTQG